MSDLTLNVAMIGPRRSGKTSVLSIMLGEIENFINRLNSDPNVKKYCSPKVKADNFTIQNLKKTYENLQSVAMSDVLKDGVGVGMGTTDHRAYNIDLEMSGIFTSIFFHDYPGGFFWPQFHSRVKDNILQHFHQVFEEADVILLCVDVPSQITYSNSSTKALYDVYTRYITKFIKEKTASLSANNLKKTVIIMPIKCEGTILDTKPDEIEGYTQSINPEKNDDLYNKIKELYRELFMYLEDVNTQVNAFYLPVVTMGCVKASGLAYDAQTSTCHVAFGPVYRNTPLHYYQCNSSSLLALCLLSAEAIITEKYKEQATILETIKGYFGWKWPTEWFRDELFETCSMSRLLWEYVSTQPNYEKLPDEVKKGHANLRARANKQSFTGCRKIK